MRRLTPIALLAVGTLAGCAPDFGSGLCLFECPGPRLPMFGWGVWQEDLDAGSYWTDPPLRVFAVDTLGNVATDFAGAITLAIEADPGGGALVGKATVTADHGMAEFDSLTIDRPGTGYTLTATAAGYQDTYSMPFTITVPGALVDQQQSAIDVAADSLAFGGTGGPALAQVLTVGRTGSLVEVKLPLTCWSDLAVEIQGGAQGRPNGSMLAVQSVPGGSLPQTWSPSGQPVVALHTIVFQTPAQVTAGDQIAIVLQAADQCWILQGPQGDPYAGGDAFFTTRPDSAASWAPLSARADLPFETLVH